MMTSMMSPDDPQFDSDKGFESDLINGDSNINDLPDSRDPDTGLGDSETVDKDNVSEDGNTTGEVVGKTQSSQVCT